MQTADARPDAAPDVSVLIVSYNTAELTVRAARSAFEHAGDLDVEVIVVDNASRDDSVGRLRAMCEPVQIEAMDANLGFAAANNHAARLARGRHVLLLNSDAEVFAGSLPTLVEFAEARPDGGAFGGRTVFGDGSLNPTSCWALPTLWSVFCWATGLSTAFRRSTLFNPEAYAGWDRGQSREIGVVTGCYLLMRRDLWGELGGFDERFHMYSEDTDLSARCWAAGRACWHCADSTALHHGGRSDTVRADKLIRLIAAKAQYIRKHWSPVRRGLGVGLLRLGVFARYAAVAVGASVLPRLRKQRDQWSRVWSARDTLSSRVAPGDNLVAA